MRSWGLGWKAGLGSGFWTLGWGSSERPIGGKGRSENGGGGVSQRSDGGSIDENDKLSKCV